MDLSHSLAISPQGLTVSFKALPEVKDGTVVAAIEIVAPVRGLRPCLSARLLVLKEPNLTRVTGSAFFRLSVIVLNKTSTS